MMIMASKYEVRLITLIVYRFGNIFLPKSEVPRDLASIEPLRCLIDLVFCLQSLVQKPVEYGMA